MHLKVGVRGAAGITAALVFLGANVEWNPVKAVPASTPNNVAQMCAKIDAQTYGYCCKLRLEANCPAIGSLAAKQSVPLSLRPNVKAQSKIILQKVAIGQANEDTGGQSVNSVFVNGNTEDPGRGLGANNGGADGAGAGANMGGTGGDSGENGGNGGTGEGDT